jgi:hypothetical protein
MSIKINEFISKFIPTSIKNDIRAYENRKYRGKIISDWEKQGKPFPPPHAVKQITIEYYQKLSGYNILVETGTYLGDMVEAERKNFKKIYSIELGEKLWRRAVKRFSKYDHIKIIQGDSGKILDQITSQLKEPAIFWLDGHYSEGITAKGEKDCPIFEELDAIFRYNKLDHILLIDDARNFIGKGDYPTIEQLSKFVTSKNDRYKLSVENDIIRFAI